MDAGSCAAPALIRGGGGGSDTFFFFFLKKSWVSFPDTVGVSLYMIDLSDKQVGKRDGGGGGKGVFEPPNTPPPPAAYAPDEHYVVFGVLNHCPFFIYEPFLLFVD